MGSMVDDMRGQVSATFRYLGDVPQRVTYNAVTVGQYDPATGAPSETTTGYSTKALFAQFSEREVDNVNVFPADRKVILDKRGLGLSVNGDLNDYIVQGSDRWDVKRILHSTTTIVVLQCRKVGAA